MSDGGADQAARFETVDEARDVRRIAREPLRQMAHRDRPARLDEMQHMTLPATARDPPRASGCARAGRRKPHQHPPRVAAFEDFITSILLEIDNI
jgi:hypothetical protein